MHYTQALEIYFRDNVLDTILPLLPLSTQNIEAVTPPEPVSIYFIPTTDMPLSHLKYHAEYLLSLPPLMGAVALFDDERFQGIVNAVKARGALEPVFLVASFSMLGEVGVCTMAAFLLGWDESEGGGPQSEDSVELLLLHHHVQIVGPVKRSC